MKQCITFIFIIFSINLFFGQACDVERDREALMALYNATDGDHWINNENWNTDAPLYKYNDESKLDSIYSNHNLYKTFEYNDLGQIKIERTYISNEEISRIEYFHQSKLDNYRIYLEKEGTDWITKRKLFNSFDEYGNFLNFELLVFEASEWIKLFKREYIVEAISSSTDHNENNEQITIQPNPVLEILSIDTSPLVDQTYQVEIYNISGINILSTQYEDRIDVSQLSSGLYFLSVLNHNNKIVSGLRFVKK